MVEKSLSQRFKESFPWDSVRAMARVIAKNYPIAYWDCRRRFHKAEAANTLWNHRRALIQGDLREAVAGHKGVTSSIVLGKQAALPHPWNHTQIEAGDVFLTECKIDHPEAAPRFSNARFNNSQSNRQKLLFPSGDEVEAVRNNRIYAILAHGCDPQQPDRPTFCMIRFPRAGAAAWWNDHINLFIECNDIFAHLLGMSPLELTPDEQIEDTFNPELNTEKDTQ